MYTLYEMPGSCSRAVNVLLHELGQPVTLKNVRVPEGQPRPAEFLAINPRGSVPVLVDGDTVIREGAAIMLYLMDKHPSPLLPREGAARAAALEWLMFANATLHPIYMRILFINRVVTDAAVKEQAIAAVISNIQKLWDDIEAQLATSAFVAGNDVTAADILLTVISGWAAFFNISLTFGPNTQRMLAAVAARPAFVAAVAAETAA